MKYKPHKFAWLWNDIAAGVPLSEFEKRTIGSMEWTSIWSLDPIVKNPELWDVKRKPPTIMIGDREIFEPVRTPLDYNSVYWIPDIRTPDEPYKCYWEDDPQDLILLQNGLIHTSFENAILHAEALVALTSTKNDSEDEG